MGFVDVQDIRDGAIQRVFRRVIHINTIRFLLLRHTSFQDTAKTSLCLDTRRSLETFCILKPIQARS